MVWFYFPSSRHSNWEVSLFHRCTIWIFNFGPFRLQEHVYLLQRTTWTPPPKTTGLGGTCSSTGEKDRTHVSHLNWFNSPFVTEPDLCLDRCDVGPGHRRPRGGGRLLRGGQGGRRGVHQEGPRQSGQLMNRCETFEPFEIPSSFRLVLC